MSRDETRTAAVASTRTSYAVAVSDEVGERLSSMDGRVVDGTAVAVGALVGDVRAALAVETSAVGDGAAVPARRLVRAASRAAVATVRESWGAAGGRGVERFGAALSTSSVVEAVSASVGGSHLHVDRAVFDRLARVAVAAALDVLAAWLERRHEAVVEAARRDRVAAEVDAQRGYATVGRQRSPRPAVTESRGGRDGA